MDLVTGMLVKVVEEKTLLEVELFVIEILVVHIIMGGRETIQMEQAHFVIVTLV